MLDPRYNPPYRLPKNPRDWIDPRRIEMQLNRQRTLEQARKNPNDPMNWRNPQPNEMRLNHLRTVEQNKNNPNNPMNWRNPQIDEMELNHQQTLLSKQKTAFDNNFISKILKNKIIIQNNKIGFNNQLHNIALNKLQQGLGLGIPAPPPAPPPPNEDLIGPEEILLFLILKWLFEILGVGLEIHIIRKTINSEFKKEKLNDGKFLVYLEGEERISDEQTKSVKVILKLDEADTEKLEKAWTSPEAGTEIQIATGNSSDNLELDANYYGFNPQNDYIAGPIFESYSIVPVWTSSDPYNAFD